MSHFQFVRWNGDGQGLCWVDKRWGNKGMDVQKTAAVWRQKERLERIFGPANVDLVYFTFSAVRCSGFDVIVQFIDVTDGVRVPDIYVLHTKKSATWWAEPAIVIPSGNTMRSLEEVRNYLMTVSRNLGKFEERGSWLAAKFNDALTGAMSASAQTFSDPTKLASLLSNVLSMISLYREMLANESRVAGLVVATMAGLLAWDECREWENKRTTIRNREKMRLLTNLMTCNRVSPERMTVSAITHHGTNEDVIRNLMDGSDNYGVTYEAVKWDVDVMNSIVQWGGKYQNRFEAVEREITEKLNSGQIRFDVW